MRYNIVLSVHLNCVPLPLHRKTKPKNKVGRDTIAGYMLPIKSTDTACVMCAFCLITCLIVSAGPVISFNQGTKRKHKLEYWTSPIIPNDINIGILQHLLLQSWLNFALKLLAINAFCFASIPIVFNWGKLFTMVLWGLFLFGSPTSFVWTHGILEYKISINLDEWRLWYI